MADIRMLYAVIISCCCNEHLPKVLSVHFAIEFKFYHIDTRQMFHMDATGLDNFNTIGPIGKSIYLQYFVLKT